MPCRDAAPLGWRVGGRFRVVGDEFVEGGYWIRPFWGEIPDVPGDAGSYCRSDLMICRVRSVLMSEEMYCSRILRASTAAVSEGEQSADALLIRVMMLSL